MSSRVRKRAVPGRRRERTREEQPLNGTEWQTLSFFVQMPGPDGFTVTIRGPAGNRIEMDSVRIVRRALTGCYRKDLTIPPGRISLPSTATTPTRCC